MRIRCRHCLPKEGIEVTEFSPDDKTHILNQLQISPLVATKYLMEQMQVSHLEAKFLITHLNPRYGLCKRCAYDRLDQLNIDCPQCGSLNLNWEESQHTYVRS